MAVNLDFALAMSDGIASVAPLGTAAPTGMSALGAPWVDLGAISTAGLVETAGETRTQFKRWGSIVTFKSVLTDEVKTFDINCLEANPTVLGLFYKVTTPVASGAGTSAVQTVTISGTPTGGTFVLVYGDQATTDIAYNAIGTTVQAALQALTSIGANNVTVSGAAGGPYTVTFTGTLANQPITLLNATGNFTGGTTPAITVAMTTPGLAGKLLTVVDDTAGAIDKRAFVFDVLEGTNHGRFFVPMGEVTARKNPTYSTGTLLEYGMTVTAYPDNSGVAVSRTYQLDAV